MPDSELFINDVDARSNKCLTHKLIKLFPSYHSLGFYGCEKEIFIMHCWCPWWFFFVPAEFSLTVCSWRTQCLSGPQGWSKSFFLYKMLILLIALEVRSFSVDFIVGLYSWAGDDVQSSAWEDEIICLSESIEPRRWKERLAKVFS